LESQFAKSVKASLLNRISAGHLNLNLSLKERKAKEKLIEERVLLN
jgi:hypothetical protein